jgi:hypothetical protein
MVALPTSVEEPSKDSIVYLGVASHCVKLCRLSALVGSESPRDGCTTTDLLSSLLF